MKINIQLNYFIFSGQATFLVITLTTVAFVNGT